MLSHSLNTGCSDARSARLQRCFSPTYHLAGFRCGVTQQLLPATSGRRTLACQAQSKQEFNWAKFNVDKAARQLLEGLERGEDEDVLVARQLGAARISDLTDLQEKYLDKVKQKLLQRVEELKKEKDEASANFKYGKLAYEGGDYFVAVERLDKAVRELGTFTVLGGEAAMWLALAYNAVGREEDCLALCKQLEDNHPVKKVQREAANLRYILEAPKLKLSEDEKVTIPLLNDAEPNRRTGKTIKRFPASTAAPSKRVNQSSLDDIMDAQPIPMFPQNRYAQVAWAVLILGTTFYLNYKYSIGEL